MSAKLKKPWKGPKDGSPKHRLVYLDPPSSVQPTTLALAMAVAGTVASTSKVLHIDPEAVTITVQVGAETMRFELARDEAAEAKPDNDD